LVSCGNVQVSFRLVQLAESISEKC
jgi:hypothetical protein